MSRANMLVQEKNGPTSEMRLMADADDFSSGPLLSPEEEMQYQRALWVNRLLKEELAAKTHGKSIREIEEAQAQIEASMREVSRAHAWSEAANAQYRAAQLSARSNFGRATSNPPAGTAPSALNRRKQNEKIRQENLAIDRRLQNIRSVLTPRKTAVNQIPKLHDRSRLLPLPPDA